MVSGRVLRFLLTTVTDGRRLPVGNYHMIEHSIVPLE